MTDNIVFEAEPDAQGRYRVEVWDGEMWLRVGQDYGYDDLGEAKQIASYHAWQWGEKTRVVDTQPETTSADSPNGAQDATPAETRTSTPGCTTIHVAPPHRYVIEKYFGLDDWAAQYSEPDRDKAITGADHQATMTGILHRVIDTQAEPAVDEAVREPDNKIGTLYVDIVPALNATCKENAGEFTDPAEPVNETGRFDEGDLRHALDIAFAGFRCACDACAEFEAACTARERGSEPTSKPCKSDMDTYQRQAKTTAVFTPDRALEYLALGLTSEAGEVAGKAKKIIRDHDSVLTRELRDDLAAEVGDVLWYAAVLADHLGFNLSDVADLNLAKLADRQERGVLGGSGDDR